MIVNRLDRFDINQGELGNCWFLAAMANLVENQKCFNRVVPAGQTFEENPTGENQDSKKLSYHGIFKFRFWRFASER